MNDYRVAMPEVVPVHQQAVEQRISAELERSSSVRLQAMGFPDAVDHGRACRRRPGQRADTPLRALLRLDSPGGLENPAGQPVHPGGPAPAPRSILLDPGQLALGKALAPQSNGGL